MAQPSIGEAMQRGERLRERNNFEFVQDQERME